MPNSFKIRKVIGALERLGFRAIRQKGSHVFYGHPDGRTTTLPVHRETHIRLLSKIVKKDLKIEMEDFLKLF